MINCWLLAPFLQLTRPQHPLQKGPLMWIHLSLSPKKVLMPSYEAVAVLIQNCKIESQKYFGKEPDEIFLPYSKQQLDWLLQKY